MLTRSALILSTLSSLVAFSHAFPLMPHKAALESALRRRVAYSVVAVDGNSAATSSTANAPANVPTFKTIIQTFDQTETVTASVTTLHPSTETVVSTQVVTTSEPAKTVEVSVTQGTTMVPSAISPPSYNIVNADDTTPSPTIGFVTETSTAITIVDCTSSTSSASSATTSSPSKIGAKQILPSTSSQYTTPPTEIAPPAEAGWVAPAGLLPPSSTVMTYSSQPTTSSKTYDDGMWHTTWRTWNVTATAFESATTTAIITPGAYSSWNEG